MRATILLAVFACLTAGAAAAQEASCMSQFHSVAGGGRPYPGSLGAHAGQSCFVSVYGEGRGQLRLIKVLRQPKNGIMAPVGTSGFRFTPRTGFTGQDFGVVLFRSGKGPRGAARVRFAIDVR